MPMRLAKTELTSVLGDHLDLPPNANRLIEVDAIFFRDPRTLIRKGFESAKLRKLIALLVTYLFLPEAVFSACRSACNVLSNTETAQILEAIRVLHSSYSSEMRHVTSAIARAGGLQWAQYMWVPYPSA